MMGVCLYIHVNTHTYIYIHIIYIHVYIVVEDGWLLSALSMLAAAGGVGDGAVDEQVLQIFEF
jgi:hypothetical protein